ncbi:MAG: hypothetical protein PHI28_08480 [Mangrovibacterium sp.]|nr:hypothetical protein [Mangrovibacterium sp.]
MQRAGEAVAFTLKEMTRYAMPGMTTKELDGFWADNGGSFVLGEDIHHHQELVNALKFILKEAIDHIKGGVRIYLRCCTPTESC